MSRLYERNRYIKRKADGKIQPVAERSEREQRHQCKLWRANSKRSYKKRLAIAREAAAVQQLESSTCHQAASGKKRAKVNSAKLKRKCDSLQNELQTAKKLAEKWKKHYSRLESNPAAGSPSPKTVVQHVVRSGNKVVKRKLLFAATVEKQLKHNVSACTSERERQLHAKVISGRLMNHYLKKYNIGFMASKVISTHLRRKFCKQTSLQFEQMKRANSLNKVDTEAVTAFLEQDLNSCVAPGKKDCITKRQVKKQKRYLNSDLRKLYVEYLRSSDRHMSYSSFCRLRPFWLVKPRVSARDTCMCVKHVNMEFRAQKLRYLGVLDSKSTRELCDVMCCSSTSKKCMHSECATCQTKKLPVTVLTSEKANEQTHYQQWMSRTEQRQDRKKNPLTVKVMVKSKIVSTIEELVTGTEKLLPAYMSHVYNVGHQYASMHEIKLQLAANEIMILIDFSENYRCKYSEEVQSAHFGASKAQVHCIQVWCISMDLTRSNASRVMASRSASHSAPP